MPVHQPPPNERPLGQPGRLPCPFGPAVLRRLVPADLAAFQAYRAVPELGRFQGWTPMGDAQALAFIDEMAAAPLFAPGRWLQLAIADAQGDALLGDIGLHLSADGTEGEVGFTLSQAAQGRGIATAAVHAALGLFWAATPARRVLGITDARNAASVRLLQRLGFARVATRALHWRGEACTEWVHALDRGTDQPGQA